MEVRFRTRNPSTLAIPPGEYLAEVLTNIGMTEEVLAHRMGLSATQLSQILSGEKAITPETAEHLERIVGVPRHIWTGLETEYRMTLAGQESDRPGKASETPPETPRKS